MKILEILYYSGFFLALAWAAVSDWRTGLILDKLTLPLWIVGLPASIFFPVYYEAWWSSAAGSALSFFLLLLLARLGKSFAGREALGGGDIKLAAAMGAFLGVGQAWKGLVLGAILGLPLMLVFLKIKGLKFRDPAPFGPGLCLGSALVLWNMLSRGALQLFFDRLGL